MNFAARNPALAARLGYVARGVSNSVEFARVLALPRRVLDDVPDVTPIFAKPGGTMKLHPRQSAALIEAALMNGLFAPLPVGAGKALIALCLVDALDSKKAVLLIPAALKRQVIRDIEQVYSPHFNLAVDRLTVITYNDLSQASKENILEELAPDLLIADECHAVRNHSASRTKRLTRFLRAHFDCRFCALSGTITSRSILDYAHLIEFALRKSSPLPRGYRELHDWAGAIDVKPEAPLRPGVLMKLCAEGEDVRAGFRRRLVESPGVIAGDASEIGTGLIVRKRTVCIPERVARVIQEVRKSWSLEGEEFQDILSYHRSLRQLACGFYYRWAWPAGSPDFDWLAARGAWHKAVREKLKQSLKGLDSPLLLAQAADRHLLDSKGDGKRWNCPEWADWKVLRERKPPPTETIWLDTFLCDEIARLAPAEEFPTIIWYDHRAVGERLGEILKLPVYGEGTDVSELRDPIVVASLRVHGTGRNLQNFCSNILASVPSSGTTMEQLIGRTHRFGQQADEVTIDWFGHTPECEAAMMQVMADARYVEESTGAKQKILLATKIEWGETDNGHF